MRDANGAGEAKPVRRTKRAAAPSPDAIAATAGDRGDVGRSLGPMIRRTRKRRQLTLQQLADFADLSVSYISQIERNLLTPTVATLKRIASALDIPAGKLMFAETGSAKSRVAVLRRGHRKHVRFPQSSISYELLTPDLMRRVSALWLVANPGAEGGPALTHEGEDIVIVLSGELSVDVAGTWHDLKAGDSIYFSSELSHRWRNRRKQPAQAIWISSPPYF